MHAKSASLLRCLTSLSVVEITLALVFLIQAVPTDEKEKGNTGNCNGGNSITIFIY